MKAAVPLLQGETVCCPDNDTIGKERGIYMAKKGKNSNYKPRTGRAAPESSFAPREEKGPKRIAVTAIRWGAWMVLLSVILTQLTGNTLADKAALGMFVIAGMLYAISLVLERKYHW